MITYVPFNPARRPEEYVGQPGPHNGLALDHSVIEAIGKARITNTPHPFLVRGEWIRDDGVRYLDVGVDVAWITEHTDHQLVNGVLRYVCPGCGRMSGAHSKGCDQR